jgi:hypothetical protein
MPIPICRYKSQQSIEELAMELAFERQNIQIGSRNKCHILKKKLRRRLSRKEYKKLMFHTNFAVKLVQ